MPLAERDIPIIADAYVDMAFGTGCVKITPAHDFNDHEVGARHDLQLINIFNEDASINQHAPAAYHGLSRAAARERVVADLDAKGLLAEVKDHKLMVPRGDRSGAVIEPLLTDQWFVKIAPLAAPAIAAVENGDIQFVPKQYENVYFAWMRDIQDWCISRQQWWGHRIPAFYDDAGNVYVARDEQAARSKYGLDAATALTQESDVLETWFSSAMWPFATLGWPEDTQELEDFLPSDTLITGHDIIFFWVARMIMMTLRITGKIPFKTVYIHGLVKDAEGNKMSKTKGNGLDPLDFIDGIDLEGLVAKRTSNLTQPKMAAGIEKKTRKEFPNGIPSYGTDALRFTFCALATTGRDVKFDLNRVEGYHYFCNKLWNATKFVLMNTENLDARDVGDHAEIDRWIRTRFNQLLKDVAFALETYRFDVYANALYEFAWHEYCDWYLEFAKSRLWDDAVTERDKNATRLNLLQILEGLLRATHPVMPFITEQLWQEVVPRLAGSHATIINQDFPKQDDFPPDHAAFSQVEWLKKVITSIRNIRGEANIKPNRAVSLIFQGGDDEDRLLASKSGGMLQRLANIEGYTWLDAAQTPPPNALAIVEDLKIMVPLAGLIDVAAERARIEKDIAKSRQELERIEKKLSNDGFVSKAPADVVAKERGKADALQGRLSTLAKQLEDLERLGDE